MFPHSLRVCPRCDQRDERLQDRKVKYKRITYIDKLQRPYIPSTWNYTQLTNQLGILKSIPDGSCYFHSIMEAFYVPYRLAAHESKKSMIKTFRKQLADILSYRYEKLGNGSLKELGKSSKEFSLESMRNRLLSNGDVDLVYQELLMEVCNLNIYILSDSCKPYLQGYRGDLIKQRSSIILYNKHNHFDLVAVKREDRLITVFTHDDMLLKELGFA